MNRLKAQKTVPLILKFSQKVKVKPVSILYNELWEAADGTTEFIIIIKRVCKMRFFFLNMIHRFDLHNVFVNRLLEFSSVFFVFRNAKLKWNNMDNEGFETIWGKKILEGKI